jgi:hypothetical protein
MRQGERQIARKRRPEGDARTIADHPFAAQIISFPIHSFHINTLHFNFQVLSARNQTIP